MEPYLEILFTVLQIIVGGIGVYQIMLGFVGYYRKKETKKHPAQKSFAILIAAHNEEAVVGALLENLKKLDYPQELYDTFVICDNCTDRTAEIVMAHQVRAMQRFDPVKRGKGHAIEWMLEQLWQEKRSYDAVVILDADNLVSPNFLSEMNEKLVDGKQVIQGYLETKNPYDSWVSLSYALMYWYMNRAWQLSRYQLRLPNNLGGTGMCITTQLLKEIGWGANSLTEDIEFTARCVERNIYPTWAHDAIVYDEKPIDLASSMRQRLRWMQGHFYCARQYFFRLVKLAMKNRNFAQLDASLYLFQPFRLLLFVVYSLMLYFQVATSAFDDWGIREVLPDWFWVGMGVFFFLQTPIVLLIEKKPLKAILGYIPYQFFLLTWLPLAVYAFFTSNNTQWSHTRHTRAIRIEELSK
ncbi:glycosyltransferase family 2 protein [Brevibacillus sp. TJ4]|uniref:glycosyltransferase family 2 protein n=1 Tax=Brevibacillus sp. TJ4 TaxID=3234853 RepID=UPI0037D38168